MSWTDRGSIKVIKYLRDKYKIRHFIETGTYKGTNTLLQSQNFDCIMTCEINKEYYKETCNKVFMLNKSNAIVIFLYNESSPKFLKWINKTKDFLNDNIPLFYLDAHFYNSKLPKSKRFVVKNELKALRGFGKSIIVIHDFDNGLGHIRYDDVDLDMNLLKNNLYFVNPGFYFYTNTLEGCDIVKTKKDIKELGLPWDEEMKSTLKFVWSKPIKTFRGILYCLPTKLTDKEIKEMKLREWK
jgi:hypothetical protein